MVKNRREYSASWRKKHPDYFKKKQFEYRTKKKAEDPEAWKAARKAIRDRYNKNPNNRIKINARRRLKYALISGKMKRPKECDFCLQEITPEAHHPDYNQPLLIIWLCKACHEGVH